MEAKQCPKGHYYDTQKYTSCPYCKENGDETTPIGGTIPLTSDNFEPLSPTEPITADDYPAPGPAPSPDPNVTPAEDEPNVTKPYDEANLGFVPTVGWVICIRGPHKGQDFRLVTGYNKIGRSSEMAVSLPMDDQISRDSHAIIAYEPIKKKFFAAGDKNMIYINDSFIMGMQEIHANDVIRVGASELMFVPLCGDVFSWD